MESLLNDYMDNVFSYLRDYFNIINSLKQNWQLKINNFSQNYDVFYPWCQHVNFSEITWVQSFQHRLLVEKYLELIIDPVLDDYSQL